MSEHSPELFFAACQAPGPLQLGIKYPWTSQAFHKIIPMPFALVGRDCSTDVILEDSQVSRRHAYLQMIAGRLFCVDLRSRTGTHWEHGPEKSGWLDSDQSIRIGPFFIRNEGSLGGEPVPGDDFNPLTWHVLHADGLPDVTLEFLQGVQRPAEWHMSRVLTLMGRAKHCMVELADRSVSSIHCALLRTPASVWIVDLLGRGGTTVNGEKVRWSRVDDGDEIRVGKFLIRMRCGRGNTQDLRSLDQAGAANNPPEALTTRPVPETINADSDAAPSQDNPEATPSAQAPEPAGPAEPSWIPAVVLDHKTDLVSTGPAPMNWTESVLLPLVNQFGLMQQQMIDQFQQIMMTMVQMFTTLHQDQMEVLREEMQRVHELTQELQQLQVELAKHPAVQPGLAAREEAAAATAPGPANAELPSSEPLSPGSERFASTCRAGDSLVGAAVPEPGDNGQQAEAAEQEPAAPMPAAAAEPSPPASPGPEANEPAFTAAAELPSAPQAEPGPAESAQPSERTDHGQSPPAAAGTPAVEPKAPDVHVWLQQRIAQIQRERQSHFQKILNYLLGK